MRVKYLYVYANQIQGEKKTSVKYIYQTTYNIDPLLYDCHSCLSVPDVGYSRNAPCALNVIPTFLLCCASGRLVAPLVNIIATESHSAIYICVMSIDRESSKY